MATQNQVKTMVDEHVLAPASTLIYNLYADDNYQDALFDLMSKPDYETPARDAGYEVEQNGDKFYVYESETSPSKIGKFDTVTEAWEYACEVESLEPYTDEAYEHWIVSDWLARKLEKHGEIINHDFMGLAIWGRCATGQNIYLDGVMHEIFNMYCIARRNFK